MESLVKTVSKQEDAASIFKRAPKKDVLDNRNGHYAIPSMFDWFMDNYFIKRDAHDQPPPG